MKLCNFASLDRAHKARGIAGLRNVSDADRRIFDEFDKDWQELAAESEAALDRLGIGAALPGAEEERSIPGLVAEAEETETVRSVRIRRVQALFRATVLASYDFKCAISGISVAVLIQASHIIPWAREPSRRLDPRNGIALSVLHDRAFDRGLITFDEDLRVVVSGRLRVGSPSEIHRVALLGIEGRKLRLPTRYAPDPAALAYHREHIFTP